MKLKFLGGTGTVTGSKYLLTIDNQNILIDCGLFQGLKNLRLRNWSPPPIDPSQIDALLLTHAHLDHSGYIPLLVHRGYKGPIYCSSGTKDLAKILLPDSGYLQEEEARFANKHGSSKHHPAMPLYTRDMAIASLKNFKEIEFNQQIQLTPNINVTFIPAGHILGASLIRIQVKEKIILFSGDLGRSTDPIMNPPSIIEEADVLIVESTYGNRNHEPANPLEQLEEIILETVNRGGKLIIPAFAVGRAQMILYYLSILQKNKKIPSIPIYLNSPMAINATKLYQEHASEHKLSPKECEAMFGIATFVQDVEESKRLNTLTGPAIIISASGMATGGRILHHLRAFAPDPKNTILLAGYQAPGTRGASIASGADHVRIFGEEVPIRAQVVQMHNLSAHADSTEIMTWLKHFKKAPKQIYITHGEPESSDALRRLIDETLEKLGFKAIVPEYLESVSI